MMAPGWVLAGEMHRPLSILYYLEKANRPVLQERHTVLTLSSRRISEWQS